MKKRGFFRILFIGIFMILFVSVWFGKTLKGACSENVITLLRDNGDGTGKFRLNLAKGSCTFTITLYDGQKKGKMYAAEDGVYYYEIPGTKARLVVKIRTYREAAEFGQCMKRDVSYYERNAAEYNPGYAYAGTGWMTRTETLVCHRFRMKKEGGERGTGYAWCAVVYVRPELTEYQFVLEAVSKEEADIFGGSFVYTPRGD